MKTTAKRVISMCMTLLLMLGLLPQSAFASNLTPAISIDSVTAIPGDTIEMDVSIANNPGILGATLTVSFQEGLTLTKATAGEAFSVLSMTKPGKYTSPCNFVWDGQSIDASDIKDGVILTLTFAVSEDVASGTELTVNLSAGTFVDADLNPVTCTVSGGTVSVIDYMPGDLNRDQEVNITDVILARRQIAGGYEQTIHAPAADVNADGYLDITDVILMRRFIAGGYDVVLKPSKPQHEHTLEATAYKAPTCLEEGNIAYWYCTKCGNYYSDEAGTVKVDLADTVIAATGHTVVVDPAVPATETTKGRTEGSHCSVCLEVLVAQEEYGPLAPNTANIIYKLVNESKDPYLAQQTIQHNNPDIYKIGEELTLSNDLTVPGYTFVGWFDSFDESATQIKTIPSTSTKDITLYAHWKENDYEITYNLYQTPITSAPTDEQKTYTVSKGNSNLYNPEINNYIFLGWYDNNGVEYKTIPVGTTGNIVLNAYYTSLRNLAVSKEDNNPIIVEDTNNHVVYFTYEIGEIRNIPLNGYNNEDPSFWEIQSVAGLSQQFSQTYTTTVSKQTANSVSDTISNMTVNSNTWTLSKEWYEETNVNETWAQSIGKEAEQCKTDATTSSGTLSISNQMGGSSYHKTEDGSTVYDYDSTTTTKDKGHQFEASLGATYSNKLSANLGASNEYGTENSYSASNAYTIEGKNNSNNWSASGSGSGSSSASDKDKYSAGISYENGYEINAGLKYGYHNNTNTVTKTGSDTVTVNSDIKEDTNSWNNSATFSSTNSRSSTETVRNTLSDIVTTTKGYGKSYSNRLTDGETQGFSSTASNTSGTTSTVTYSELESSTTTTEYSVDGHIEGKYRCILVGKAHVFGVVGYDYNTKSYFTYTFSVMDDKTEEFLDYTPKGGDFTDCENSCVPFEIPMDIYNYVKDRTAMTSGIGYRTDSINGTAKITSYNGTDTDVIVPAYVSDGTQAYRVTEIASSAFAGKPVRVVVLGELIKSIPDAAFKDCAELEDVIGSFTEIGAEAFAGCENLSKINIPSSVVKIGKDAFAGVPRINVRALNSLCAYAEAVKALPNGVDSSDADIEAKRKEITQEYIRSVLESGAQNITLDLSLIVDGTPLTLEVPEIQSIEINGGSKTYRNFSIKSNAESTTLTEMIINNTNVIPMTVASDALTLRKVFVSGNTMALILKKDGAVLSLIQDSAIQSTSKYAVIGKNPVIQSAPSESGAEGSLNVDGNFGYVNSIRGTEYFDIANGDLILMTDEEFAQYIHGMFVVTFDANGGQCDEEQRFTAVGNEIGELPVPTREYYTFDGWYTERVGGEQVSADTIFSGAQDVTVYAHWTDSELSDWTLASEVPSDAKIVNQKWTYTLREYTTSGEANLSGWTKYDLQRTGWGATQGPVYTDPSNGYRNVWSEQYVVSSNYKTVYHYYRYSTAWSGGSGSDKAGTSSGSNYYTYDFDYELVHLGTVGNYSQGYRYYYTAANGNTQSGSYMTVWKCDPFTTQEWIFDNYGTRWYYQEPVYTYYYYRDVAKESASNPTGQENVSNIQEWVQYRSK